MTTSELSQTSRNNCNIVPLVENLNAASSVIMLSQEYKRGTITESLAQIREEEESNKAGEIQDVVSQEI